MKALKLVIVPIILYPGLLARGAAQATDQKVAIYTADEPPTNYFKDGKLMGTSVDIVNELRVRLSIKEPIKSIPWPRAYKYGLNKPNIALFTAGKSPERIEKGFHFIGPVITRRHVLFGLKEIKIKDMGELKKYRISGLIGDWRTKLLLDHGIPVDQVNLHDQSYQKLKSDRADLIISSDIEALVIAKKYGIEQSELKTAWVIKEAPSFIMLSEKTSPEVVTKWQKTFEKMKRDKFFNTTLDRWSKELGAKVRWDDGKGYIIGDN